MSTTVGEAISRVRNTLKAVKEDPFLTDRTIYFSIIKYGQSLMKREDNQLRLMKISNIFKVMPYVELIEVDKVDAACVGVYSGCYFKRTKERIPDLLTGIQGPIFRTDPGTFVSMTKTTTFKYNKRQYFWYLDGYLYFPNLIWDAVKVEAIFENDTESCDSDKCLIKQEQSLNIPDYLFSEVEQYVVKELAMTLQVPTDGADDGQNTLR